MNIEVESQTQVIVDTVERVMAERFGENGSTRAFRKRVLKHSQFHWERVTIRFLDYYYRAMAHVTDGLCVMKAGHPIARANSLSQERGLAVTLPSKTRLPAAIPPPAVVQSAELV